jgi:PAS domain S-box-containing protein
LKYQFISKNLLIILFVFALATLISTNLLMYIRINDGQEKTEMILNSQSKIHTLQNISSILLHDHLHSEIHTARRTIDSLIKSLQTYNNDSENKSLNELSALAQQRLEYQDNTIRKNYPIRQKNTRLLEEHIRNNNYRIKALISELISQEINKRDTLMKKSHSSALFSYYVSLAGVIISLLILTAVFYFQLKKMNTGISDSKEISYEELESIVRDRTAEIARINRILNQKISEISKIDNELKRSIQYYEAMFEHAHDPIIVISADNKKILEANKMACEIYGFSKEEFTHISFDILAKNKQQCKLIFDEILTKGYVKNAQCVHFTKNMTEILMEINASLIRYNGNTAILCINRDITERILRIDVNQLI